MLKQHQINCSTILTVYIVLEVGENSWTLVYRVSLVPNFINREWIQSLCNIELLKCGRLFLSWYVFLLTCVLGQAVVICKCLDPLLFEFFWVTSVTFAQYPTWGDLAGYWIVRCSHLVVVTLFGLHSNHIYRLCFIVLISEWLLISMI